MDLLDKKLGGLYGLLLGDAIGVPFEFKRSEDLKLLGSDNIGLPFVPVNNFKRSHDTAPDGAWSDDGAQALALLHSLDEHQDFNLQGFAKNMLDWNMQKKYCVDGILFDIGLQTSRALINLRRGIDPSMCGPDKEENNGNGSLMRVLPLALWHNKDSRPDSKSPRV